MGSSKDCQAKGRSSGMSARVVTESTPKFGQNTTICRSSNAPGQRAVTVTPESCIAISRLKV